VARLCRRAIKVDGPVTAKDIAEHASLLKDLARDLVDAGRADDLAQETLLVALDNPPRERRALGSWFRAVLRTRAANLRRLERRRKVREEANAIPEAQDAKALNALETEETKRMLAALVMSLPAVQRSIIELRYQDGLKFSDIGQRLGTSTRAVGRLHVLALADLRRQLDARSNGDRSHWVVALLSLASPSTRPPTWHLAQLGLAAAAVALVWWAYPLDIHDSFSVAQAPIDLIDGPAVTASAVPRIDETGGRRESTETRGVTLRGRVSSSDGAAIEGADVLWIALAKKDLEDTPAWPTADWGVPSRPSLQAITESDGSFEFIGEPIEDMSFGSVLVALYPGHCAGGTDLPPDLNRTSSVELLLEPAAPIKVRVVDSNKQPQRGAVVHHVGASRRRDPSLLPGRIHERFLLQQALTDERGEVELASFSGEQALWAEKGDLVSIPWQGSSPQSLISLALSPSFTIGGSVSITGKEKMEHGYEGERRILVFGLTGNLWRPIQHVRDVSDGKWGPVRFPLDGVSRCKVRLEGYPIIPVEQVFDLPPRSAHKNIAFESKLDTGVFVLPRDTSGDPIMNAYGEAWWESCVSPNYVAGAARPDGMVFLGSFPTGIVRFRIAAPGYSSSEFIETEIVDPYRGLEVVLHKAGSIAGRCLHKGLPLSDFEVIYWRVGNAAVYRNKTFLGRADGHFELPSLEPGDWSIQAASPSYPSGRPQVVTVVKEQRVEVELDLPAAIRGGGRVLAADTGEPIADALVQPYSSSGLSRSFPWGAGGLTVEDGSFDLDAFVLGQNQITVEAAGFALTEAQATAIDGDFLDWGDIRISRPQTLTVNLRGIEHLEGVSPTDFRATADQGIILPETSFDADGVVRFENVPPGELRLLVSHGFGAYFRLQVRLDSGKDWTYDLQVGGGHALDVHVTDAKGQALPFEASLLVAEQENSVIVLQMARLLPEELTSFQGIRAQTVQVFVLDINAQFIASRDINFGESAHQAVEIRIGEEPLRVRIVDVHGDPIPSASLTVRSASGAEIRGVAVTGADGWAELVGLPPGHLMLDVRHVAAGRAFGIPIEASAKEFEYVLDAGGTIELTLLDGDVPLAGVLTRIQTTAGITLGEAPQTDEQGRVRYDSLGAGIFDLACHRADCWPASVVEELTTGEQARLQVQMRRLTTLDFFLHRADGVPISGAEVELRSSEFDASLAEWLALGRIQAKSLTTDAKGSLHVEGLPRGRYSWSVASGEQPSEGSFELSATQENRIQAYVQP
jgi:RNA polymerase sigma factor (sigma-70 family)